MFVRVCDDVTKTEYFVNYVDDSLVVLHRRSPLVCLSLSPWIRAGCKVSRAPSTLSSEDCSQKLRVYIQNAHTRGGADVSHRPGKFTKLHPITLVLIGVQYASV